MSACNCPERDGKIYHQRISCTDPDVSALGWYADERVLPAADLSYGLEELAGLMGDAVSAARELLDSEPWTCRGCGGQFIGARPVDYVCRDCRPRGGAR